MYFYMSVGVFDYVLNIYDRKWDIVIKVFSVMGLILGLLVFSYGICSVLYAAVIRITREQQVQPGSKWTKALYTLGQLFIGGWTIALVEVTLKRNKVDLSGSSITSSGQLIPLLAGAMSLLVVFLASLRTQAGKIGRIRIFETYVNIISNTATRVENVFVKRKNQGSERAVESAEAVELNERDDQASAEGSLLQEDSVCDRTSRESVHRGGGAVQLRHK
jgi:hypothetical protein